ncbi:MAG: DegV family protein [Chloroflexi bacterium]|nr:DegV family protein [Chloroflexota bacterium]
MAPIGIITDSSASFESGDVLDTHKIEVVPLYVHFGDRMLRDGVDVDSEELFHRMRHNHETPRVTAPSVEDFEAVYQRVASRTRDILVVTNSRRFSRTHANALAARKPLLGRCEIVVIDSLTTSAAQGYLVWALAKAAEEGAHIDDMVRLARAFTLRIYSVFYVSTLDYIQRSGLIAQTQAILGDMLQIKPLLTMEDGELMTMEKVRTHTQAVDRMMEFVTEFTTIERLCILQSSARTNDRTRMLQDRLALELSRTNHPLLLYEPLLASLIGPDAMGMALIEDSSTSGLM